MRVLLFAHLRDIAGTPELVLPTTEPVTVGEFWRQLLLLHPALAPSQSTVRLARNLEFATPETMLLPGDEVALLPPVSGG